MIPFLAAFCPILPQIFDSDPPPPAPCLAATCALPLHRPCLNQHQYAATAAQRIGDDLQGCNAQLSMGLASGKALLGNLGAQGMKTFCVLGTAVQQAHVLDRLVPTYKPLGDLLLTREVAQELAAVPWVALDVLACPCTLTREGRILIAQLLPGGDLEDNEWMYQLQVVDVGHAACL